MTRRRLVQTLALALCAVLLSAALLPFCVAESGDRRIVVPIGGSDPALSGIKRFLYEKGYYFKESIGSHMDALDTNMLDDLTMSALYQLSLTANDPDYSSGDGMTQKAHFVLERAVTQAPWTIPDGPYPPTAPEPVVAYPPLHVGDDDDVQLHERLVELKYLHQKDDRYQLRKITPLELEAMHRFLDTNNQSELYKDDPNEISTASQELLFNGNPLPYQLTFTEKLQEYFTGKVSLAGLQVPMLVLWIIGLVLLVVCIVLFIHFFRPAPAEKGAAGESWNRTHSQRRLGKPVRFEISYNGKSTVHEEVIDGMLKIGRNVGSFPLNMEDTTISRRHCELYYQDSKLMLRDYSSGGTMINGEMVHNTQHAVNSSDQLKIGEHVIKVTY